MAKNTLIALLLVLVIACKKDQFSTDDTNSYKWKRDLYRAQVQKEEPAAFYSREGGVATNQQSIVIRSDFVVLTEYCKDKQQDSMFNASGKMLIFKYEKLEQAGD
jgi:hypothetical protein